MNRSPAFQFYPDDYLSDINVELMTLEEQGAYMRLICHAWKSTPVGTLPHEDEILAQLSRLGEEKWKQSKSKILRAFILSSEGLIVQKRLVAEHEKQKKYRKQRVNAGKMSAAKRQRELNECSTSVQREGQQNSTLHIASSSSFSSTNKESFRKKNREKEKVKIFVPEDFEVSKELETWAKEKHPTVNLTNETYQFLDHHRARSSKFSDWIAAWRTWIRNAEKFQSSLKTGPSRSVTTTLPSYWNIDLDAEMRKREEELEKHGTA